MSQHTKMSVTGASPLICPNCQGINVRLGLPQPYSDGKTQGHSFKLECESCEMGRGLDPFDLVVAWHKGETSVFLLVPGRVVP